MGDVISFMQYKGKRIEEGSWPDPDFVQLSYWQKMKKSRKELPTTAPLWYWDEIANYDEKVAEAMKNGKMKQVKAKQNVVSEFKD